MSVDPIVVINTVVVENPPALEVTVDGESITVVEVSAPDTSVIVSETASAEMTVVLTPTTVVTPADTSVGVVSIGIQGPAGPQGIQGPPGAAGSAPQAYVHDQSVPSDTWTINHSLGYYPNVTIINTLNRVVWGELSYPSITQVVVTFTAAFSGKAYLS